MRGLFSSLLNQEGTIAGVTGEMNKYVHYISIVFLSICASAVALYGIYIGFKFFKAEDEKARQDAKTQLIYSIIGVVSIAVIAIMLETVVPMLKPAKPTGQTGQSGVSIDHIDTVYEEIGNVVDAILAIITNAAVIFSVYIGWQLMKAEDDAKRKNAKMQLMYVIIGVVAVVLLNVIAQAILTGISPNYRATL